MLPPSNIFDPAKTHCPSCNATLNALTDACSFCGFSAHICVQRYPFAPPQLTRFVDPDQALSARDQRLLSKAIKRLERRFPQITVTVASMELPETVDGREFGYWFLNRSEPSNESERLRRLHHILILIDRNSRSVSITVGYGLDCFLDDQLLFLSLERVQGVFSNKGAVRGICAWIKDIGNALLPILREASFARDRWARHQHHGTRPDRAEEPQQLPTVSQGYSEVDTSRPPVRREPRQIATPSSVSPYEAP